MLRRTALRVPKTVAIDRTVDVFVVWQPLKHSFLSSRLSIVIEDSRNQISWTYPSSFSRNAAFGWA